MASIPLYPDPWDHNPPQFPALPGNVLDLLIEEGEEIIAWGTGDEQLDEQVHLNLLELENERAWRN